jgi:predicted Zn-dependent protease
MGARLAARRLGVLFLAVLTACGTLSVDEEKQLGHAAQREVRERFQLMRDRVVVNYIRDLGDSLVEAAEPSAFDFRFYVVEDEEINAFAVPGGAIYIHTGLIQKVDNVAELAGVLAHEIGHVTARHVAHLYRRQRNTGYVAQVFTILVAILTGSQMITNAASLGTGVAATAYLSEFGRDAESESDHLAVETLVRAGYDPNGLVTMFQKLQEEGAGGGGPQFLSSHPTAGNRIQEVSAEIAALGPLPPLEESDGGKLEIIQRRIELIYGTESPTQ